MTLGEIPKMLPIWVKPTYQVSQFHNVFVIDYEAYKNNNYGALVQFYSFR